MSQIIISKAPRTFLTDSKPASNIYVPSFLNSRLSTRFKQPNANSPLTRDHMSVFKPQNSPSTAITSPLKSAYNQRRQPAQQYHGKALSGLPSGIKKQHSRASSNRITNQPIFVSAKTQISKRNSIVGKSSSTNLPIIDDKEDFPVKTPSQNEIDQGMHINIREQLSGNSQQQDGKFKSKWGRLKQAIQVQSALKSFLKGNEHMGLSQDEMTFYRYSYLHSRKKIKNSKEINELLIKSKETTSQIRQQQEKISQLQGPQARRSSRMLSLHTFHFKKQKSKDHGVIPFSNKLSKKMSGLFELEENSSPPGVIKEDPLESPSGYSKKSSFKIKKQPSQNQLSQQSRKPSNIKTKESDEQSAPTSHNQTSFLNIDQIAALELIKKQMIPVVNPNKITSHSARLSHSQPIKGIAGAFFGGLNSKMGNNQFQPSKARDVIEMFAPDLKKSKKKDTESSDEDKVENYQHELNKHEMIAEVKQKPKLNVDKLDPSQWSEETIQALKKQEEKREKLQQQMQLEKEELEAKIRFNLNQKNPPTMKSIKKNDTINEEDISSTQQSFEDFMQGPMQKLKNKKKSGSSKGKKLKSMSMTKLQMSQIQPITVREQEFRENLKQTTNFLSHTQQSHDIRNLMIRDHLVLTIDKMQRVRTKIKDTYLMEDLGQVVTDQTVVTLNKYLEKIIFKIYIVSVAIVCKPIYSQCEKQSVMTCPVQFGPKGIKKQQQYGKLRLNDKERLTINIDMYCKMLDFMSNCSTIFFFYSKKKLNYIHMPKDISEIVFQCDQLRFNIGLVIEEVRSLEKQLENETKGEIKLKKEEILKEIIKIAGKEDKCSTIHLVAQLKKLQRQNFFGTNETIAETRESKVELNKHISLHLREYASWKKKITDPDKYRYKNFDSYKDCTMQLEDMIDKMVKLDKIPDRAMRLDNYMDIKKLINNENFSLKKNKQNGRYLDY